MIKNLLIYVHILAIVTSAGLTLWLLHDLWFVLLAVIIALTLMLALAWRRTK